MTYIWIISVHCAVQSPEATKESPASYIILLLFDLKSSSNFGKVGQEHCILRCEQSVLSRVCG